MNKSKGKNSKDPKSQLNDSLYDGIDDYVKVPSVDAKFYDKQIEAINEEVAKLREKLNSVSKQIADKNEGKSEYFRQKDLVKKQVDDLSLKINSLESEKKHITDQIFEKQRNDRTQRTEISSLKKKIGFESEAAIDDQIGQLEYQLQTETLTLKREKELITKISALKATKPQLKDLTSKSVSLNSDKSKNEVGELRARVADLSKKIADIRDERRTHQNEFNQIVETRKNLMSGMSDVFDLRDSIGKEIGERMAKIRGIRDEKRVKMNEMRAAIEKNKSIDYEKRERERKAWETEQESKREQDALAKELEIPFADELELVDHIRSYLHGLRNAGEAPLVNDKNSQCTFGKKQLDDEDDFMIKETNNSGGKKKDKKKKKENSSFTHTLETLAIFSRMNISPPASKDGIEASLRNCDEKISEIEKRQEVEYQQREIRRKEREAKIQSETEEAIAVPVN